MKSLIKTTIALALLLHNFSFAQSFKQINFSEKIKDEPLAFMKSDDGFVLFANATRNGLFEQSDIDIVSYHINENGIILSDNFELELLESCYRKYLGEMNGDKVYLIEQVLSNYHAVRLLVFGKDLSVTLHEITKISRKNHYYSALIHSDFCFISPDQKKIGILYENKKSAGIIYVNENYELVDELSFSTQKLAGGNDILHASMSNAGEFLLISHNYVSTEGGVRLAEEIDNFLACVIFPDGEIDTKMYNLEYKAVAAPVATTINGDLAILLTERINKEEVKYTSLLYKEQAFIALDTYNHKSKKTFVLNHKISEKTKDGYCSIIGTYRMPLTSSYGYFTALFVSLNPNGTFQSITQSEGNTNIIKDHQYCTYLSHDKQTYILQNVRNLKPSKYTGNNKVYLSSTKNGNTTIIPKPITENCYAFLEFTIVDNNKVYFLFEQNKKYSPKSIGVITLP